MKCLVDEYYTRDGAPKRCAKCNSDSFHTNDFFMDYLVMEQDYLCSECGQSIGYWAYGYFNPDYRRGLVMSRLMGSGTCHSFGDSGQCGVTCPLFLDGECENVEADILLAAMESDEIDEDVKDGLFEAYDTED